MINLFICLTPYTEKPINNVKYAIAHGTARWLMSVFTMWAEQSECNGKTLSWSRHTCQTNTSSLARRGQVSFYTPLFFHLELTAVRGDSPGLQSQWMIHLIMEADWRKHLCNDLLKDMTGSGLTSAVLQIVYFTVYLHYVHCVLDCLEQGFPTFFFVIRTSLT